MSRAWWALPGPAQFVQEVAARLGAGQSVILQLPARLPTGLRQAIRAAVGDYMEWKEIRLPEVEESPLEYLCRHFLPDRDQVKGSLYPLHDLAMAEEFHGHVFWLTGTDSTTWPPWRQFIQDYSAVQASAARLWPAVFCVPLEGVLAATAPREDARLLVQRWWGRVSRLDTLLYVADLFQSRELAPVTKQVAIAVVASLALWDPVVADYFADQSLVTILQPEDALRELAQDWGWAASSLPSQLGAAWEVGLRDCVDGGILVHSVALALRDSHTEIRRRVWRGELEVLLPLVEERRLDLAATLSNRGDVVFLNQDGGVISDIGALEIGPLAWHIQRLRTPDARELQRQALWLREIRNALAHGHTVDVLMLDMDPYPVRNYWEGELFDLPSMIR